MKLEKAWRTSRYVTIRRRRGWSEVDGFVAELGEEWCAVLCVVDLSFEGVVLLRRKDIRAVRTQSRGRLARRWLQHEGMWPPSVPEALDLDSARGLVWTAGGLCRVLALSNERDRPRTFQAGSVHRITSKRVDAWEIGTGGRWRDGLISLPLARLTKVVLWDPYVDKVTALADAAALRAP